MYCCQEKVKNEFVERWKNKMWDENEDRDDIEFWEQQKMEYLQDNPTHAEIFGDLIDDEEDWGPSVEGMEDVV